MIKCREFRRDFIGALRLILRAVFCYGGHLVVTQTNVDHINNRP